MNTPRVIVIVLLVLVCTGALGYAGYQLYIPLDRDLEPDEPVHVSIESGSSVTEIGDILEQEGVIRSSLLFGLYARFSGKSPKLQAGEYQMPTWENIPDVVDRLVTGKGSNNDISVTIPEGFNTTQIFTAIIAAGVDLSFEDDAAASHGFSGDSADWIYDGKPEAADLTGYLFPDTYQFYGNSTGEEIVEKMVDNLRAKITPEMRTQIEASPYSFYELLTLASIVEKEVLTYEERRLAAGVFFQRLTDNYPLQSDATLNYVTGHADPRATASDLAIDSPYNSYARVGLPPTPICNPGLDSIKAVLDPVESDYYFFLTTPGGKAIFSRTLDEHLQHKAIYYP
jgi:UPF0755 protein